MNKKTDEDGPPPGIRTPEEFAKLIDFLVPVCIEGLKQTGRYDQTSTISAELWNVLVKYHVRSSEAFFILMILIGMLKDRFGVQSDETIH